MRSETVDNVSPLRPAPLDDVFPEHTLTGECLRALRGRPIPKSPLPGILDPRPSLHLLAAEPKAGKTTFFANLATAAAAGASPWAGAPALPQGRVLFLSAEQQADRVLEVLDRVAKAAGIPDRWTDHLGLIARDDWLHAEGRRMLTLDEEGIGALERVLDGAAAQGDPVRYLVLDSLSRLAPPGLDENDNSAVTEWVGGQLAALAYDKGAYIWAIHHRGHSRAQHRSDPISASRGASAYSATAQVVMLLEKVPRDPRRRRLRVRGNAVPPATFSFHVTEGARPDSYIDFFRPVVSLEAALDAAMPVGNQLAASAIADAIHKARNPSSPTRASGGLRKQVDVALSCAEGTIVTKVAAGKRTRWTRAGSFVEAEGDDEDF